MKIYKCDMCSETFDPKRGMIKGWFTEKIKINWASPDGSIEKLKIDRTMKIYKDIPATSKLSAHKVEMELDVCPLCVRKLVKV